MVGLEDSANPTILFALVLVGVLGPFMQPARAAGGPSDAEVAKAIAKGVDYLRSQQEPNGQWSYRFNANHRVGITALAGLALLENGVDRTDAAIKRARAVVREAALDTWQTYDLSLAILFLARVQPETSGPDDELIARLGERLARGEYDGGWSYEVPRTEQRAGSSRGALERLLGGIPDNSNTQFALLGVWGAGRHGFDSNDALEAIDRHFRTTQDRSGRWGYHSSGGGSPAMSCAGLMGLAIAAARPKQAERQTARARGAALAADPAFTKALDVVTRDAKELGQESDIYYLWSLERVCVALGLRKLGDFDWYAAGAEELLRRQRADGHWESVPQSAWGELPSTCLALLFLRKANLAFELDRVLKLPGSEPRKPAADKSPTPEEPHPATNGEADVVVRSVDEKGFPDITIDFEVKRPDGSALLDAKQADFHVKEYGKDVGILTFRSPVSQETRPTTVVLVVDHSRSMEDENRIGALKEAVRTFLKVMPGGSRVAVVAFSSKVELICPFTDDPQAVQSAADKLRPAGETSYYDAVAEALDLIGRESGRRAVLALTDGEDTFSHKATIESAIKSARNVGVPVHTLGLGSEDEIASDDLKRLAKETRGQYFPARQADQLRGIYEELAKGLGQSYSLTYRTDRRLPDGTLRPIQIAYRASKKVTETAVFIPGMVVPAAGWSGLFLILVAALVMLALGPALLFRRSA
jgi:VWFA-related protein